MKKALKLGVALACGVLIAGCGGGGGGGGGGAANNNGGGGGGGPIASTNSFNAQAAYKSRLTNGATDNFTLSGNCVGTATIGNTAATATTFEGVAGTTTTQTTDDTFTNCFPQTLHSVVAYYFDANGAPIGSAAISTPQNYVALAANTTQAALPASVKVGDSGTLGNYTIYSDNTKQTVTGSRIVTWTVEADTATTAIINISIKDSNTSGTVVATEQDRYRIDANGALTVVTINVVAGVLNLTYTKM
jgi:hypothetical protein